MKQRYWLIFGLILAITSLNLSVSVSVEATQKGKTIQQKARAAQKAAKENKENKILGFEEEELEGVDLAKERAKYFSEARRYPFKYIPLEKRVEAIEQTRLNNIKPLASSNIIDGGLKPIGPAPLSNGRTLGPSSSQVNGTRQNVSGRITALAIDSKDPNTIYLGGAQGGVWRSLNAGQSWTPITDDAPTQAIGAITLDPTNSDIIYVGTGEGNFSGDSFFGMGLLKSTDRGQTWQNLGKTVFLGRAINKVVVDPTSPNTIYVGSASAVAGVSGLANPDLAINGVYKSTDGGQTFTPSLTVTTAAQLGSSVFDIDIDSTNPQTLYATINGQGVFKTTNGGTNWNRLAGGLPSTGFSRIDISVARSNPSTLYAAVADGRTDDLMSIYKSTDAGNTWTTVSKPPLSAFGNICQCSYDNFIEADPTNPNIVYFGGVSLYRSDDGGQNWSPIGINIHVDQHAIAFTPGQPNRLFFGNDGGVWMSNDNGRTMTNVNNNLNLTQFQSVSIHPTDPNITLGGTQDNGTNIYQGTNTWVHVLDSDGGFSRIDQMNPNTMYSTFFNLPGVIIGPLRSDSGGGFNTWVNARNGINQSDAVLFYAPLELDPNKMDTLYFGTFRLYRTTNKGVNWTATSTRLTRGNAGVISNIGVSKVGSIIYTVSTDGGAFVSKDGGNSFQNVTDNLPQRYISDVASDSRDPNLVYVSISGFRSGHIFKSTKGGGAWQDITGNLPDIPANALALNPTDQSNIFVGTDIGLFETMDGGKNWALAPGMPMVAVFDLDLNAKLGIIRIATHGRGIYEGKVSISQNNSPVTISSVAFTKPTLSISGTGFGNSGAKVSINNQDISSFIRQQSDTAISLTGNKKKLKLVKGPNTVTVSNNGGSIGNFVFNF